MHYLLISFLLFASIGIAEAADVTVNFVNGSGTPITTGASLKYYDGLGWHNATDNGDGSFTADVNGTNISYKMYYNNGTQQKSELSSTNPVQFQTSTTTLSLKDSDGGTLTGDNVKYYQNGWSGDNATGSTVELLPGSYSFKMYYHNGTQQINSEVISGTSDEVLFTTVSTLLSLEDGDGGTLTGDNVKYYQNGWSGDNATGSTVELLPGSYSFKMYYHNGTQQINSEVISGTSDEVLFTTVSTLLSLEDSDGNTLTGDNVKYYQNGWSGDNVTGASVELLPGSYSFKMYYHNGTQQINGEVISGASDIVLFTTVTVNPKLVDCDENGLNGGNVKYYQNGWSGDNAPNTTVELLPGSYSFKMYYNYGTEQRNGVVVAGNSTDVTFSTTQMNYYYSGTVKFYQNGWGTYTQGMHLLPGNYSFKFGTQQFNNFVVSDCSMDGNVYLFNTKQSNGSALPNIPIYRNDYGNHFISVGTTDANGLLFTTDQPSGQWKFRASKNYSQQDIIAGGANTLNFQSCRFITHVKKTDGSPFEGIATDYSDYNNHWIDLSPSTTDANGNAYIELFAGDFKFMASKNYSSQQGRLELTTPGSTGTVNFQTSTYTAHVMNHDGSDQAGVSAQYSDYNNHWINLSPSVTDANGNASIELFPGNLKFKATKNYSTQEGNLEITDSGDSKVINFQTALAQGLAKDCELGNTIAGIKIQYSDYNNHWIDLNPGTTGVDGLASMELFPGTYSLKASTIYTSEIKPITLAGPTTTVEFNPTRVSFNYPGTVKYSDYNNHWITINPNTYMFAGTHKFRFYNGNTLTTEKSIAISGCSTNQALIFVQMQNSSGASLAGGAFDYRIGWGTYNDLGVDATGDGYWTFLNGNPTNAEVRVKYKDASITKIQNVQVNPVFIFNTVNVSAKLKESDDVTEITSGTNWEYRIGWAPYQPLTIAGDEILPVNVEVKVGYKDATNTMIQNVGTTPHFAFNTKKVTAKLLASDNSTEITSGTNWEYRIGWGSYHPLTSGEEMLPGNVEVKIGYKNATNTMIQNVGTTPDFTFNTKNVTADLFEGANDLSASATWEYRIGWGSYQALSYSGEDMLPGNVEVKATYASKSKTRIQNVGTTSDFHFTWDGSALFKSATDDFGGAIASVKVYPNPSNGAFMIENVTNYFRLSVYDMTGKVVYQSDINKTNNQNIRLDNPVPGAYMIQLEGIGTTVTTPIMIK